MASRAGQNELYSTLQINYKETTTQRHVNPLFLGSCIAHLLRGHGDGIFDQICAWIAWIDDCCLSMNAEEALSPNRGIDAQINKYLLTPLRKQARW